MKHFIANAKNDIPVYVNLIGSEVAELIARSPRLLTLAADAVQHTNLKQATIRLEYDMGHTVGYDFAVETSSDDGVFYAQQQKNSAFTRFIKNGKPQLTTFISLILQRDETDASYTLTDIQIGRLMPPKTGSSEETTESKRYWLTHAVIFRDQPHQSRSLTKTCPY